MTYPLLHNGKSCQFCLSGLEVKQLEKHFKKYSSLESARQSLNYEETIFFGHEEHGFEASWLI